METRENQSCPKRARNIYDGIAQLGEALAIVIRYVQENFKPTQRLLYLEVLVKPLKSPELEQRLMSCLAVNHGFGRNMLLATMRDGAAVNGAAIQQLSFFYPNIFDVTCFIIDNVGPNFQFRLLDIFFRHWISLFANSYNAKLICKERTDRSMRSYSNTRWWKNTAEANLHVVNFLDVTFDLTTGKHKPYRKPNDDPLYIHITTHLAF